MCKLCERDKKRGMAHIGVYHVRDDRLAVLEKDHLAMERLRNTTISVRSIYVDLPRKKEYRADDFLTNETSFATDPADAILGVKEE